MSNGTTSSQTLSATQEYDDQVRRKPLVTNDRSVQWITQHVSDIAESRTPIWWWIAILITTPVAAFGLFCLAYQISTGVGVWGENHPVGWAWDITNFVFWIGIGHAGTLISAILFLTRQKWRTSINRAAEAMTIFAVICAGIFPAIHVGRVWFAWYLFPIPNSNAIWQNFRSPLLWDVFAVSTYFTVSLIFWYIGMVPDLATMRDRSKSKIGRFIYGVFALGWRGANRHWRHYEMAYLVLAGISTPLVLSVHSVVSFDFATSVLPGWHATIFPPYFVAGAIFGGFAMVLTILIPARLLYPKLKDMITAQHIDKMCKIILLTGSMVGYAYAMEFFMAWYSGSPYEIWVFLRNRVADPFIFSKIFDVPPAPYWWAYWSMIFCNVMAPQVFWFKRMRHNLWVVFIIVNLVNAGMWFERFVIIVTSLHRDFLPSSWGMFHPTWAEIGLFVGTFGIFLTLFLVFMRFVPMIAMFEIKTLLPETDPHLPPSGQGEAKEAHH
ncbi:MAG TPA: NrfD/PsrC family molybdoenzyme membrane anchor subunit [Chthoniobacteraceae bacterium]|nr:NrfD/PsrC family molybdoenzyme membrane anchor subunit [Chthoniobacteraceae bacterium]